MIQKEESDDNLIAEKLKVFEILINEYTEMRNSFTGNDQQFQDANSNQKLFQDNPELFFFCR